MLWTPGTGIVLPALVFLYITAALFALYPRPLLCARDFTSPGYFNLALECLCPSASGCMYRPAMRPNRRAMHLVATLAGTCVVMSIFSFRTFRYDLITVTSCFNDPTLEARRSDCGCAKLGFGHYAALGINLRCGKSTDPHLMRRGEV